MESPITKAVDIIYPGVIEADKPVVEETSRTSFVIVAVTWIGSSI